MTPPQVYRLRNYNTKSQTKTCPDGSVVSVSENCPTSATNTEVTQSPSQQPLTGTQSSSSQGTGEAASTTTTSTTANSAPSVTKPSLTSSSSSSPPLLFRSVLMAQDHRTVIVLQS